MEDKQGGKMKIWKYGLRIKRLILRLKFKWYDLWIGCFHDRIHGITYLILIPTLVLEVQILPKFIMMDFSQMELRVLGRYGSIDPGYPNSVIVHDRRKFR